MLDYIFDKHLLSDPNKYMQIFYGILNRETGCCVQDFFRYFYPAQLSAKNFVQLLLTLMIMTREEF